MKDLVVLLSESGQNLAWIQRYGEGYRRHFILTTASWGRIIRMIQSRCYEVDYVAQNVGIAIYITVE